MTAQSRPETPTNSAFIHLKPKKSHSSRLYRNNPSQLRVSKVTKSDWTIQRANPSHHSQPSPILYVGDTVPIPPGPAHSRATPCGTTWGHHDIQTRNQTTKQTLGRVICGELHMVMEWVTLENDGKNIMGGNYALIYSTIVCRLGL
jgi:hypothetical protein